MFFFDLVLIHTLSSMMKLFCISLYFPSEVYTRSRKNLILFFSFFVQFLLCARSPPYVTPLGILDEVSTTMRHFAGDVGDLAYFRSVGATLCVALSKIIETF